MYLLQRLLLNKSLRVRASTNRKTIDCRSFKNFGHKREPVPLFTTLWLGFLTFTFIGCCINWKVVTTYFLGEPKDLEEEESRRPF